MHQPDPAGRTLARLLNGRDVPVDSPDLPRVQPMPLHVSAARLAMPGGRVVTAVAREWRPGDAARCRLCPAGLCSLNGTHCLVLVDHNVAPRDTPLLATHGLAEAPPVPARREGGGR